MVKIILGVLSLLVMLSCSTAVKENTTQPDIMETNKKNLGNLLALYPKPMTVVGAEVEGKVNWLVVGHTGVIGHDRILVIDASPLTMECEVVDIYETDGFDNFICAIVNTYAASDVLDSDGKLDYTKLKPVLFEFPTYSYLATGEIIGKCLNPDKPGMCVKEPMTTDGIVRLSKIEVYPQYLDEYMNYATEVGEISLRTEPGVLTMYAVGEKENPCKVTILETYASREAYEQHIASEHFQKYKQGTLHMVKSLVLSDQTPLNPANKLNNFMQ